MLRLLFSFCEVLWFALFFIAKSFVFASGLDFLAKSFVLFCKIFLTRGFVCVFCMVFFCAKGLALCFCKVSFVLQLVFFCFVALQSVVFFFFFMVFVHFCKCCFLARGSTFFDFLQDYIFPQECYIFLQQFFLRIFKRFCVCFCK